MSYSSTIFLWFLVFFIGYYIGRAYAHGIIQKEKQKYYDTILFIGMIGMGIEYCILEFFGFNYIGKKYSMWIYVLHMNVYNLIRRLHLETIMTNETVLFVCNP